MKISDGLQVLSVFLGCLRCRVVLQAAHDVEDGVLGEHELEQRVLVQQENVLEDLVEVVEAVRVVEVLAHAEHFQELLDVPTQKIFKIEILLKICLFKQCLRTIKTMS